MIGLTKKAFHDFLLLLHSDPIHAGHEYENIRRKLTSFFRWNHCQDAESLADETIDRVIKRSQELRVGNVRAYINGVARNVFLEARRRNTRRVIFDTTEDCISCDEFDEDEEHLLESRVACLKQCLESLTPEERQLILEYGPPEQGIEKKRKQLAESLGITPENLRVQVFRARKRLRTLVNDCLKRRGES